MSTLLVILVFAGLLSTWAVLWALFLRFGLGWAKASKITTRKVVCVTFLFVLCAVIAEVGSYYVLPRSMTAPSLIIIMQVIMGLLIPTLLIVRVFKLSKLRALQACLPTLAAPVIVILFQAYVLRPYVAEAFTIPLNSMAPTLLGKHSTGTCTQCPNPAYGRPKNARDASSQPPLAICAANFHVTTPADYGVTSLEGDRAIAVKLLKPRRWDLIVFQMADAPPRLAIKRVVGMPGEEITISDGAVWADGKRLTPPDTIAGIEYRSEMPALGQKLWGTSDKPAKLSADEYFVLGDFSDVSADSRNWRNAVPGRSSFAVPQSHVRGVVTHIYWPLSRWRILR